MTYPIYVLLDNIRSAFNVGAFFRTSDAAGIKKLLLAGITPYPPHSRIPKTALGSTQTVDWQYHKSTIELIKKLQSKSIPVIAIETTKSAIEYTRFHFPQPVCIVFGNEVTGISEEVLNLCDKELIIPMHGSKKSLNVEVSYGIIVYGIIRQFNL